MNHEPACFLSPFIVLLSIVPSVSPNAIAHRSLRLSGFVLAWAVALFSICILFGDTVSCELQLGPCVIPLIAC